MLPRELHGFALLGGFDGELHRDDAVVEVVLDLVARIDEDVHHLAVLRQHVGDEATHAALLGDGREVLEQDRADALALKMVGDVEGDLGQAVVVEPVITRDADDLVLQRRDDGGARVVVDVREAIDVLLGDLLDGREEPQVDRLVGLLAVEFLQIVGVGRDNGPHVRDRSVTQNDVGLPRPGVVVRVVRHQLTPRRRSAGDRPARGLGRRSGGSRSVIGHAPVSHGGPSRRGSDRSAESVLRRTPEPRRGAAAQAAGGLSTWHAPDMKAARTVSRCLLLCTRARGLLCALCGSDTERCKVGRLGTWTRPARHVRP